MGEALFQDVGHELIRGLPVAERAAVGIAPPGAEVHFVDGQGVVQPVPGPPPVPPGVVLPGERGGLAKPRRGGGPDFMLAGEGIGLEAERARVSVADLVLVERRRAGPV